MSPREHFPVVWRVSGQANSTRAGDLWLPAKPGARKISALAIRLSAITVIVRTKNTFILLDMCTSPSSLSSVFGRDARRGHIGYSCTRRRVPCLHSVPRMPLHGGTRLFHSSSTWRSNHLSSTRISFMGRGFSSERTFVTITSSCVATAISSPIASVPS